MAETKLTYRQVNRDIVATLAPAGRIYWLYIGFLASIVGLGFTAWTYQIFMGMGVAGITHPNGWGVYIITFVFWVGIAHSGTLISAVLFLFRARWRTAVYRAAEAMTVFAVMTAGLFPLIHVGRMWKAYWLLPYPNQRQLWPNFKSPLMWDVLAVNTYLTISALFFYLGLIPDFAAARDRSTGIRRMIYGALAMGWNGRSTHWNHYMKGYLVFAAIATPLVLSVHSVVSWDFAMSIIPGWHTTIFAPYFVAGAIHSGLAMVITLLIPMRRWMNIKHIVTVSHLETMAKVTIATGLIVGYAYFIEFFIAAYSGSQWEIAIFLSKEAGRPFGPYAIPFWIMVSCNCFFPMLFCFRGMRRSIIALFIISLLINVGMWFERFVIIVTSLSQDFMPYAWGFYKPTWVELVILTFSFAWFLMLFSLFSKHAPIVSMTEVKEIIPPPEKGGHH
jgi:molybdopterin-containing oxidoreductase family membrane subunit